LQWLPLRQRRGDIAAIANRLLQKHAAKMSSGTVRFNADAERALMAYSWPGNVRELDNVVQRALILQRGTMINASDLYLDPYAGVTANAFDDDEEIQPEEEANSVVSIGDSAGLDDDLQQREFEIICETLRDARGNRKSTAARLGISERTLRYKLARMRERGLVVDGM
jgi:two-component system response regulator FlrC